MLPKEAAEAADDYSSHTGDAASSGEGSKEENSDCGCDATKREAGQTKMKDDDAEAREARYSEALNRATGGEDPRTAALVQASGGWFTMGSDAGFFPEDAEGPTWKVKISPFLIGKHEISNQRFADFVAATGYKTEAELFGNSFVVEQFVSKELSSKIESAVAAAPWWIPVDGSDWLHPEGPDSNLTSRGDRWDHPAVHVSYNDALAFCQVSNSQNNIFTLLAPLFTNAASSCITRWRHSHLCLNGFFSSGLPKVGAYQQKPNGNTQRRVVRAADTFPGVIRHILTDSI